MSEFDTVGLLNPSYAGIGSIDNNIESSDNELSKQEVSGASDETNLLLKKIEQ